MIKPKKCKISCNLLSASIFIVRTLSTNRTPCFTPFFTCLPLNSAILSPLQKKKVQKAVGYTQLKKKKMFLISPSDASTYKKQLDPRSDIPCIRSSWATAITHEPLGKTEMLPPSFPVGWQVLFFCSPCF